MRTHARTCCWWGLGSRDGGKVGGGEGRARTQQIEHEKARTLVGDSLRAKKKRRDKRSNRAIPPARVAPRTLTRMTDKKHGVTQLQVLVAAIIASSPPATVTTSGVSNQHTKGPSERAASRGPFGGFCASPFRLCTADDLLQSKVENSATLAAQWRLRMSVSANLTVRKKRKKRGE